MRTVQMTLDDNLVDEVDRMAKKMATSRSAFTRDALRAFLDRFLVIQQEKQHRHGYEAKPVDQESRRDWQDEQQWGDNDETW